MFLKSVRFQISLLFLLISFISFSQIPLSKKAKISILTCDKGEELYSLFGHTAIRIHDESNAIDIVYNYGTFDFNTKNFYLKFIKGDLKYFVSLTSFTDFYYQYVIENRSVEEQVLNLSQTQKQLLFETLNKSTKSDEKYYTYKFIDRNCTNMVVDKINQTLGENYIVNTTDKKKTYREILFPYLKNHFYENLGINIIFGKKVDESGERLFLPDQFMESLKTTKINGKLLSEKSNNILTVSKKESKTSLWNNFYSFCLLLIFFTLLGLRKRQIFLMLFGILGLLGVLLLTIGFYSNHEELAYNFNILLFNPLLLLLVFNYWRKYFKTVNITILLYFVSVVAYLFYILDKPNFMMFLPIIFVLLIGNLIFYLANKKMLLSSVEKNSTQGFKQNTEI